jgi:5-methylcytosine-specific restriction endonuclease McrA
MRRSKYTAELLAPIVASSQSLSDVIRKLGLTPNGGNHRYISARVRLLGLDTSHFGGKLRTRIERVPYDELLMLVASSSSVAQMLDALGLPAKGRAHHELKKYLETVAIDTSHFTGPGWARGHTKATHPALASSARRNARTNEDVFVENSPEFHGSALCRRLLEMGWEYKCALCGISDWCGLPLVLHLDHINGINNDNRLVNLRLLCPNCHSQTDTYCNRRRPRPPRACEPRARYSCYMSAHASVA